MKPVPRAVERLKVKRASAAAAALVRRMVRLRDKFSCRHCGATWTPENPVDVHHLKFRSMGGGDTTDNLLCLCRACHALVHAWRLFILGENANDALTFEAVQDEEHRA